MSTDKNPKILITGALGQIGTELTEALRERYGNEQVITSDIRESKQLIFQQGPHEIVDVMDTPHLDAVLKKHKINQVYHLAAFLSAVGEKHPLKAWRVNMDGLLNILEACVENGISKLFWPSSIAVFGKRTPIERAHQYTVTDPHTIYGISKLAGERWCHYYHHNKGLDVRSIRYPGIISWKGEPGGGTTDYAVSIYYDALQKGSYECYLEDNSYLPMMYMPDAIKATLQLMDCPQDRLSVHSSYNVASMSFSPVEISEEIQRFLPNFQISYKPDFRREIARNWPASINDEYAQTDWNWAPDYDLHSMTQDMLLNISRKLDIPFQVPA